MFIFLMLFAFGYSFFAQCMDFDKTVTWLQLVKHRGVADNAYPKPREKYYFKKINYSQKCEKSKIVIKEIKGGGDNLAHTFTLSEKDGTFIIDSNRKGIRLSDFEDTDDSIVVFLNTENKIIGAISNKQLKMLFCTSRYSCGGQIPVDCQAIDNIISLHSLTDYPEFFQGASAIVSSIVKKYNSICNDKLHNGRGVNTSWIETEYKSILTQETKEIKGALVPFIMNMQAEETKKKVIAVQDIQRQQKISNENKQLKNFTYSFGVGSLLAIMLCVLCYYKLS